MPDKDVVLAKIASINTAILQKILITHLKDLEDFYTAVLIHFQYV